MLFKKVNFVQKHLILITYLQAGKYANVEQGVAFKNVHRGLYKY